MKQQSSGKGFAVLSLASIICKVLAFAYLPFQTWIVGYGGNGIISKGYVVYIFVYALTNAGLPVVISKLVSEQVAIGDFRGERKTFRCAFSVMMTLGVVAALLTFLFADWISRNFCTEPQTAMMLKVIAPTFLFTSLSGSLRGYYQGRRDMRPTAVSQIIEQVLNSILTVVFIKLFFDYAMRVNPSAALSYAAAGSALGTVIGAAGSAAFLVYLYAFINKKQRLSEFKLQSIIGKGLSSRQIYQRIMIFAIPAVISAVAASAIDLIDVKSSTQMLQAAGFDKASAVALFGIYAIQYQKLFALAAITFAAPLVTSMIPSLSAALAQGDWKYFHYKIDESYRLIFLTVLPIIAGLSFLSKPILTLIFGYNNDGSNLITIGIWIAVLSTIQIVQSGILMSLGHPLVSPVTTLIGISAKLICNYTLIRVPGINIYGAILGNALTWLIAIVLNQIFIQKVTQQKLPSLRHLTVPAAASLVMGAICLGIYEFIYLTLGLLFHRGLLVNDISIFITVLTGAYVYFILLIKTGSVHSDDIFKLPMGSRLYTILEKLPFIKGTL